MTTAASLLSPEEVARACGLSRRAVYRAIERGELPAFRLCSRLRIRQEDVDAWMRANRVEPRSGARAAVTAPAKNGLRRLLVTEEEPAYDGRPATK